MMELSEDNSAPLFKNVKYQYLAVVIGKLNFNIFY